MLKISKRIYKEMLDFARGEKPNEACGILGGTRGNAAEFYPMANTENSPESYLMDQKEQFTVIKDLRAKKMDDCDISFPPAQPSLLVPQGCGHGLLSRNISHTFIRA